MTASSYPSYPPPPSDTDSEDAPLLSTSRPSYSRTRFSCSLRAKSPDVIFGVLFVILFFLSAGGTMIGLSCLRIFEDIICHNHYGSLDGENHIGFDEPIDESLCKVEPVQHELNLLLAGYQFFCMLAGLVMTVPYGLLADRIGRKPLFVLSITGMVLAGCFNFIIMIFWTKFPLRLIWCSSIFILIGGGEPVAGMMFFAMTSDITTDANRSNRFMWGGCAGLLAELFAPSLTSLMMIRSPWIPVISGMALLIFGTSLFSFIPETLHLRASSTTLTPDSASDESHRSSPKLNDMTLFAALRSRITTAFLRLHSTVKLLHSVPAVLLLFAFLTTPFGRVGGELSLRYISNRFHWQIRQAGFLLSMGALINFILLLIILPFLSHILLHRLHVSSRTKDLTLARGSVIMLTIGALLIGLGPTIGIGITGMISYTLGTGLDALTRSLITTLVDQQHVGRLYAAISVTQTCGLLTAGPLMASLYSLGLKWKGPWVGLPYMCLAIIDALAAVAVWTFGFISKDDEQRDIGVDDEDQPLTDDSVRLERNSSEA